MDTNRFFGIVVVLASLTLVPKPNIPAPEEQTPNGTHVVTEWKVERLYVGPGFE